MSKWTSLPRLTLGHKSLKKSISDNIRTIIYTSPGECPFRPRFGIGAEKILDSNISNLDLAFEVAQKLSLYEKRITVKQVVCTLEDGGKRAVKIHYTIKQTNQQQIINIS